MINNLRSKSAQYILSLGLASSLLTGCREIRTGWSESLFYDSAVVSYKQYEPESDLTGEGLAIGTSMGNASMGLLAGSAMSEDERYIIKFDTPGAIDFEVDNKKLYNKFEKGDSVIVAYREHYIITLDDLNKDGNKEVVSRIIDEHKLVDAQPKN